MTYVASEVSTHGGKPNELFRFEGTYANFYYTSGQKRVSYQAVDEDEPHVYIPIAINRGEIKAGTQEDDGLDLDIELAVTNELVKIYAFQASPPSLQLTVFRYHDLSEVIAYWQGPVDNIKVSDGVATVRSLSLLGSALQSNVPNVYYQSPCNHILFDARCKVVEDDFSNDATIVSVDGRVLALDSVGDLDGMLNGGEVLAASGERRMITSQSGIEVIINFPFSQIAVADVVAIAAGCNLAYTGDCKLVFNNQINFGGFPFIPAENPFQDGIDPNSVPLVDTTCLPDPGTYVTMVAATDCGARFGDPYAALAASILIDGFLPTDVIKVTADSGGFSEWNIPGPKSDYPPYAGSAFRIAIFLDGDKEAATWAGVKAMGHNNATYNSYAEARAAFDIFNADLSNGNTITGYTKYRFLISNLAPGRLAGTPPRLIDGYVKVKLQIQE